MAGPFLGINMASHALRGLQYAMDTTGNNIANVNTRGYTRQVVDFASLPDLNFYSRGWKSVGQGAFLSNVNRVRADYLDRSMNASTSNSGKYGAFAGGLRQIDAIYGEPGDSGIASSLDRFFNAWSGLGSDPSSDAARTEVRIAGQALTDRIRGKFRDLTTYKAGVQSQTVGAIQQVNTLGERIASLNAQISAALASGGTPNELMDQRDLAVQDLSKLVDVNRQVFEDGSYAIYASGFTLVQGNAARQFPSNYDATTGTVTDGTSTFTIRSGELAGHLATLKELGQQASNLDLLANELRTQVNTPHMGGTNALGNTGVAFFNDSLPQTGAVDFDLSVDVKADARAIAAGVTGDDGDGSLAKMFAEFRDQSFAALGNESFTDYFQAVVAKVAGDGGHVSAAKDTEDAVFRQIENQLQAVSGVSVDDEMANLLKYQRSYQAAAKALTVFDSVAEDMINMLRR